MNAGGAGRGGQVERFTLEDMQNYITWGNRQTASIAAANVTSGDSYFSPLADGASATIKLWPAPVPVIQQLVDVKYKRPTTWSVNLYAEATQDMDTGDTFSVGWEVRVSVGQATNSLFQPQFFTKVALSNGLQFLFTQFQVAAQTIQITPSQIGLGFAIAGTPHDQSLTFSAWVAPLVT